MEWQRQQLFAATTLCACILEPVLVYFLGVLGVLTIPDRESTGIGSTRPDHRGMKSFFCQNRFRVYLETVFYV